MAMTSAEKAELPHVIVCGNPQDGFEIYGPFPNATAACEHGNTDGDIGDGDWWVMPIYPVTESGS